MADLTDGSKNGSDGAPSQEVDAHGHAAMLLVESLIHGLIATSTISVAQAVEIVDIASDVTIEMAAGHSKAPDHLGKSLTLLQSISTSLSQDLPPRD